MRHLHRLRHLALLIVTVVSLIMVASPAYAADATVTDCTNFTGLGTISDAVATANSGGGTVSITCTGTIVFDNQLVITNAVIINNDSGGAVTFDESSANGDNRFFTVNPGASLTLNGFTLQNGNSASDGGAIANFGTVTISNSTLSGNSASSLGGAIYNQSGGTVNITDSTLSGNLASTNGGAIANFGTVTITNSTLLGNSASTVGGAIFNQIGGTVNITDSTLSGNSAINSGAIRNQSGTVNSQNTHYDGNATNNTCVGGVNDLGGNTRVNSAGCPGTVVVNLAVDPLTCSGNNMVVNITAGDPNFNITGTAGPNLPTNNVGIASHTITGPGTWTGVTVTELTGDAQSSGSLGDITCPPPPPTFTVNTCDFASLQAAVTSANVAGGTVSITCTGTIVFDNELFISNAVTINNDSGGAVTFDESSANGDNRFFTVNGGASLTLNGFTLQNGNSNLGGAIVIMTNGSATINNSVLSGNSADAGGAIYKSFAGTVIITNSTLSGNSATSGGAIENFGTGTLTISNSTLSGNSASSGGAILNSGGGTLTINTSTLSGNSASIEGGAILNDPGSTLTITDSTLSGNSATDRGGAIYNTGGTVTINTSTLSGNSATNGGAIFNDDTVNSQNTHYEGDATNNTCSGTINNFGGNTRVNSAGCPGTLITVNLAVNPLSCSGNNMVVNITAGDPNFNITGTSGPNLPTNNVGIASHTINGPGSWVGVTVTELTGNTQSLPLGDITCPPPPRPLPSIHAILHRYPRLSPAPMLRVAR